MTVLTQIPDLIVVGGGLAGTAAAYSGAKRGLSVLLIERGMELAMGASGNSHGLVTPYSADPSNGVGEVYDAAFSVVEDHLTDLDPEGLCWKVTTALQLPSTNRIRKLIENQEWRSQYEVQVIRSEVASKLCGVDIANSSLLYLKCFVVSPKILAQMRVSRMNSQVRVVESTEVMSLVRCETGWRVVDLHGTTIGESPTVILANAHDCVRIEQASWLPVERVHGEVIAVKSTEESRRLQLPVCFDGYILPDYDGQHFIGASFRHGDEPENSSLSDHRTMLKRVQRWLPTLGISDSSEVTSWRKSCRTSTFDRIPYVGQLPDMNSLKSTWRSGRSTRNTIHDHLFPGLFTLLGFGSRGISTSFLAAEILIREIVGEAEPFVRCTSLMDPTRCAWRALK